MQQPCTPRHTVAEPPVTRMHRRPTRRGVFILGGGLLLAPASASVLFWEGPPAQQTPASAETDAAQRPVPGLTGPASPPLGWMPGIIQKPIKENFSRGGRTSQLGLVLHVQEGEGSLFERFSDPATRSSAHFWVSQAGEIEQYVSVQDQAWTQSAGNAEWVSIETSGFAGKPLTTAQVDAVARVYAWGAREHSWPLEVTDSSKGRGLGTHAMGGAPWGGHACPGTIRAGQREAVINRVRQSHGT
ncbi:peptidoglycan-binding protein [Streptomyces sp. WM6378]|nr:peptidoglycan-binding protein [Streptomyces sp. WM6378]